MDPATLQMLMGMFGGGGGGGGGMGQLFGVGGAGQQGYGGRSPLGGILGGLFGHSDRPYKDAMKQYQEYMGKAEGVQNPFLDFGKRAMPGYEQWLSGMKDPTAFINKTMGGYQESPYAKYQQEQGMRAAQGMGSASGLSGSTPLTQFAQQQAQDISGKDMNTWLQNVLGVNQQYGQGLFGQMGMGQHAADILAQMYGQMGQNMGGLAYGAGQGRQNDLMGILGGLFG